MPTRSRATWWGVACFLSVLTLGVGLPIWTISTIIVTPTGAYSGEENVPLWTALAHYADNGDFQHWGIGHWTNVKLAVTLVLACALGLAAYRIKSRRRRDEAEGDYAEGRLGVVRDGRAGRNSIARRDASRSVEE